MMAAMPAPPLGDNPIATECRHAFDASAGNGSINNWGNVHRGPRVQPFALSKEDGLHG
jgi:hypothetical protein